MQKKLFHRVFVVVFLSLATGCGIDPSAVRQASFSQYLSARVPEATFDIDTSALPKDWVITRVDQDSRNGPITQIKLDGDHRVKIMIVPAN